jgi:hypothetical protein
MMDRPANENRTLYRARPAPVLSLVPRGRRAPPAPALTEGQIQTLAEIRAKAAEIRVVLGLPPGAAIPADPLTDLLFQSRTR